jgi:hypothetical protein
MLRLLEKEASLQYSQSWCFPNREPPYLLSGNQRLGYPLSFEGIPTDDF